MPPAALSFYKGLKFKDFHYNLTQTLKFSRMVDRELVALSGVYVGEALRKSEAYVGPGVILERPTVLPISYDQVLLSKSAVRAGFLLVVLQASDAVLTSVGVERFGVSVEGNPFLRHFMHQFGHFETLALMKSLAIAVVFVLVMLSNKLPWITKAMTAVSAVYLFGAVLPWTYILFIRPLVA